MRVGHAVANIGALLLLHKVMYIFMDPVMVMLLEMLDPLSSFLHALKLIALLYHPSQYCLYHASVEINVF